MSRFAIAVSGPDRPGIVAEVSGRLLELDCNLEDVATSILRGHFSMMLIVAGPASLELDVVARELRALDAGGLVSVAWEVTGSIESAQPTHVLSVYGPDATGIVHAVASELAGAGVSICDMICRLHEGDPPVYVVTMELRIPAGQDPGAVRGAVAATSARLGLDSTLNEIEQAEL